MFFKNSENFYIKNQQDLALVIAQIKQEKIFALDTEFIRESTYYPILSLIQIAVLNSKGEKFLYIIDCLCGLDLQEFYALISDQNIIKILHSSMQDLQIFFYKSHSLPNSVFDTQIMANFCGYDYGCGYSNLVKFFFNETIDKDQQRSNWQARPLKNEQIKYALLDVFFLHEIYQNLLQQIVKNNRFAWLQKEMIFFLESIFCKSEDSLMKNFITKNKTASQIEMMKKLVFLREEWAKKLDLPRRRVIGDEMIEKMVFSKKVLQRINSNLAKKVKEIIELEEIDVADNSMLLAAGSDFLQKEIYNKAKEEIALIANNFGLKEQFLINNSDLKQIVQRKEILPKIKLSWRYDLFGKELEKIIN